MSVIHCTHSRSVVAHDVCGLELERAKSMPHGQSAQSLSGITHNRSVAIHSQGCNSYLEFFFTKNQCQQKTWSKPASLIISTYISTFFMLKSKLLIYFWLQEYLVASVILQQQK